MSEGGVPLVWRGMNHSEYAPSRRELDSHRNDGKTSYEQEEELGDEDMMDVGADELDADLDTDMELGDIPEEEDDPDRQGLIRVVPNAHLVYKRASEDGTFEELWIYNTGEDFEQELETRRAIIAGTDIKMNKMSSDDGSQQFDIWSCGNAQLLHITGLPS